MQIRAPFGVISVSHHPRLVRLCKYWLYLVEGSRVPLLVGYAVPLCSLSQMRRLESVASTRRSLISSRVRKQRVWEEIIICLLFPVILTVLQYVVQGHRYDIIEGIGCSNPTFMSVPGLIIRFIIPMVVAVTSLIFAGTYHVTRIYWVSADIFYLS